MKDRYNLWQLDELGRRYGCRPSSFIAGLDEWTAYQLDLATMMQGRWIDGKLSETDDKGKPINKLVDLLEMSTAGQDGSPPPVDNYRSLARPGLRTVKINPDGTW